MNLLSLINVAEIVKYVYIGFDVLVGLVVLFTLFSAIKKGAGKFLYKSVIKWALIAVFVIFFSKMIAELLLTIQINGQSIPELIAGLVASPLNMTAEQLTGSEMMTLIMSLATCIVRLVVIYVGSFLIAVLVFPLVKLVLTIFGIKKLLVHDKDDKGWRPSSVSILIAVIMAVAVCAVKVLFVFGPVYAIGSTATMIVEDANAIMEVVDTEEKSEVAETSEITDMLSEIGVAVQSPIVKVLSKSEYNVAQRYLDYITKTETENGEICLLKEYTNVRKSIPVVIKVVKAMNGGFTVEALLEMDIDQLLEIFKNAEAMKVLFPVIGDALANLPQVKELGIVVPENADWSNEYDNLIAFLDSVKAIYQNCVSTEGADNTAKINAYVPSAQCLTDIKAMLANFKKLLLVNIAADFAQTKINEMTSTEGITSLLKFVNIKEVINNDLDRAAVIAQEAFKAFYVEKFEIYNLSENQITAFTNILKQLFAMSFFQGHETEIIKGIGKEVAGDSVDFDKYNFDGIDWENEPDSLGQIFRVLSSIIQEQELEEIKAEEALDIISKCSVTKRDELIDALKASSIINKVLFPIVDEKVKAIMIEKGFGTLADKVNFTDMDATTLKSDFAHVFGILSGLKTVQDESGNFKFDDADAVKELLHHIFDISFIQGSEADLFNFALEYMGLKDSLESFGIVVNTTGVNWNTEIDNLAQFLSDFKAAGLDPAEMSNIASAITADNKEQMKAVLNDILALQTLRESIPGIIDSAIDLCGMGEEWKSIWLHNQKNVSFVASEWVGEMDNLVEALVLLNNTEIQFSNIQSEDLEELTPILHALVKVKSISPNGIVVVVNNALKDACSSTKTYLNADSMTVSDWDSDIDKIFAVGGIYDSFTNFDQSAPNMYKRYGIILDKMLDTHLFASGFYEFLQDYIKTMSVYTSSNPVLTDADLEISNLQQVTSWENELGVLDSFDITGGTQSGAAIDLAMSSVLLKGKVKGYLTDIIAEQGLSDICDSATIDTAMVNMETRIDNDPTYSWAKEVENIQAFATTYSAFMALGLTATPAEQQTAATNMKNAAAQSVFATLMLENFKTQNPHLASFFE